MKNVALIVQKTFAENGHIRWPAVAIALLAVIAIVWISAGVMAIINTLIAGALLYTTFQLVQTTNRLADLTQTLADSAEAQAKSAAAQAKSVEMQVIAQERKDLIEAMKGSNHLKDIIADIKNINNTDNSHKIGAYHENILYNLNKINIIVGAFKDYALNCNLPLPGIKLINRICTNFEILSNLPLQLNITNETFKLNKIPESENDIVNLLNRTNRLLKDFDSIIIERQQ